MMQLRHQKAPVKLHSCARPRPLRALCRRGTLQVRRAESEDMEQRFSLVRQRYLYAVPSLCSYEMDATFCLGL